MTCKAKQHSDQMYCDKCGIGWDMNDVYPPVCLQSQLADENCKWVKSGKLKKGQKGLSVQILKMLIIFNWSLDWTWAYVLKNGDLKTPIVALSKTDRLLSDGRMVTAWSFIFFKLSITFGFVE